MPIASSIARNWALAVCVCGTSLRNGSHRSKSPGSFANSSNNWHASADSSLKQVSAILKTSKQAARSSSLTLSLAVTIASPSKLSISHHSFGSFVCSVYRWRFCAAALPPLLPLYRAFPMASADSSTSGTPRRPPSLSVTSSRSINVDTKASNSSGVSKCSPN